MDLSEFNYSPIDNETIIENLLTNETKVIQTKMIDFDVNDPKIYILNELMSKAEIDYEACSELLYKLLTQLVEHFKKKFSIENKKYCYV